MSLRILFITCFFSVAVLGASGKPVEVEILVPSPQLDLASLEKFAESIAEAHKKQTADEFAELLLRSGITKEKLDTFRAEVVQARGQRKFQIPMPFPQEQLQDSNRRLWAAGLDFLELVNDGLSTVSPYHEIPEADLPKVKQWLRIRRLLLPAVTLTTAVMVGVAMVRSGEIMATGNSAVGLAPGFKRLISPFVAAGVGGALVQTLANKFLYPYAQRKEKATYRPFSFWGKLMARDFLFPLVVAGFGTAIAQMPPIEISFPTLGFGGIALRSVEALGLSFVSLGLLELAFERLKRSGEISQFKALKYETLTGPIVAAGIVILMVSNYWMVGGGMVAAYALGVTIPIWYKILLGNWFYDRHIRATINREPPSFSKKCLGVLGALSRVYVFRK